MEKVLSIQEAVIEEKIKEFKESLPAKFDEIASDLKGAGLDKQATLNLVEKHFFAYFNSPQLKPQNMAVNIVQYINQCAKEKAVDAGSVSLFDSLNKWRREKRVRL